MIKSFLKNNVFLLGLLSFVYNMIFSRCRFAILFGKISAPGAFLKGTRGISKGKNNKITIGRLARLKNCVIIQRGNECIVNIKGERTIISDTSFYEEDDNCVIDVGSHFTMEGGHIASTEGEKIVIGEDCMFSNDVEIRNGDSHVIIEKGTKRRLNKAKSVVIGDHVWLTAHVRVLKGSEIASKLIPA